MYIQTQADGTITQVITVGVKPAENGYEIERSSIPDEILQHIFQYKYIDGEFVKNETVLESKIDQIRSMKITNMSAICNQLITYGVDFNNEHYSLTSDDQINLMKLESIATLSPSTQIFYHPDGGLCRAYSTEEILQLANLATMWIVYHTTYFNFTKAQLLQETDVEKIINFQYGDTLNDEFNTQIQQIAAGIDTSNIPTILDDPEAYRSVCQTIDLDKLADEPIDLDVYIEDPIEYEPEPEEPDQQGEDSTPTTGEETGDTDSGLETEPGEPETPDNPETDPDTDETGDTETPTDPGTEDSSDTSSEEGDDNPTDNTPTETPGDSEQSSPTTETGDTNETTTTTEDATENTESNTEETNSMGS